MRTLKWDYQKNIFQMVDQRLLPGELKQIQFETHEAVAQSIKDMAVRGAPAIGGTAAFGMVLAANNSVATEIGSFKEDLTKAGDLLKSTRPTAVNLAWAVDRMLGVLEQNSNTVPELKIEFLVEAQKIADEDVTINKRMAEFGAALIQPGETIIHHCNTGSLATVEWGTALGVIHTAHDQGKNIHVLVDETRPRLQGSRLTAWELEQYGISYDVITDNAAGYFLQGGMADRVLVGADRVSANGDTANKIGTYMLALAAKDNDVPFYVVAPSSTIDLSLENGGQIPIEERGGEEVLDIQRNGSPLSPKNASARNPAFDITPNRLITGIITEFGIVDPPYEINLPKMIH